MIAPKKSLSQHFLIDQSIITQLVEPVNTGDSILEIGPGTGALTRPMLDRGGHVTAIEIDERLQLKHPNLTFIRGNALSMDLCPFAPAKVISNLPFQIATPLILKLIQCPFSSITVIVQNEVAKRLTATPNTKAYSALTIHTQLYARTEYLFIIPPTAFRPPPKVKSAAIRLIPHSCSYDIDIDFVYGAFRQRRKMLRNTLNCGAILKKLGISDTARPENLTLEEFASLWREVYHKNCDKNK